MSLFMEHRNREESRQELRQRISGLLGSHAAALQAEAAPDGMESDTVAKFREELNAFYKSLTDSSPTKDESNEMGGHN